MHDITVAGRNQWLAQAYRCTALWTCCILSGALSCAVPTPSGEQVGAKNGVRSWNACVVWYRMSQDRNVATEKALVTQHAATRLSALMFQAAHPNLECNARYESAYFLSQILEMAKGQTLPTDTQGIRLSQAIRAYVDADIPIDTTLVRLQKATDQMRIAQWRSENLGDAPAPEQPDALALELVEAWDDYANTENPPLLPASLQGLLAQLFDAFCMQI